MFGTDVTINAGVLLVRPNATVFDTLRRAYIADRDQYSVLYAEQDLLNYYYHHEFMKLSELYNLNSAVFINSPR